MNGGLTRKTLLSDDKVGLQSNDVVAHFTNVLLLKLKKAVEVLLLLDLLKSREPFRNRESLVLGVKDYLNIDLGLALLVLEGAVHEDNARVLDPAPHLGVGHILVEHDAVKNTRILNLASGQLKQQREKEKKEKKKWVSSFTGALKRESKC